MKSCALVVGINEYPKPAGVITLFGAVADAADFADWALHPNGGDVEDRLWYWTYPAAPDPSERLAKYLENPNPWGDDTIPVSTRGPTMSEVAVTAAMLCDELPDEGVTRIYVFFAGHGVQTASIDPQKPRQTCFILSDFKPGIVTRGLLPCDELRRALLQDNYFREVVMFLDCCRTPLNFNQAPPSLQWQLGSIGDPTYGVGLAAKSGSKAYEAPLNAPTRGAFSQVLIEGLRRRRGADDTLTLNDLAQYVNGAIDDVLGAGKQYPQFEIEPSNPPFPLLSGPPIKPLIPIVVSFKLVPAGEDVYLIDAKGARVGRALTAGASPVTVRAVASTFYSLETADGRLRLDPPFKHDGPGATHVEF